MISPLPLVSIILPVYNAHAYLKECIESIIDQTYQNWELLIINDGSTDNSEQIILPFLKNGLAIKYIKQENNAGITHCLNTAIAQSQGKYIARMDADDLMVSIRLKQQVSYMEEHVDVGVLGSAVEFIDEKGNTIANYFYPENDSEIKKVLPARNPFVHPSVMMRASVLKSGKYLYRNDYPRAEDYDLWIRLSSETKMANLSNILLKYRFHSGQTSQKSLKKMSYDLIRLRLNAIRQHLFAPSHSIYLIKPFLYWLSPSWLLSQWLLHRERRDKNKGVYTVK